MFCFTFFPGAGDPDSLCWGREFEEPTEPERICTSGGAAGGKQQAEVSPEHPEEGQIAIC